MPRRGPEGVVRQEVVAVDEPDLRHRRLGDQVKGVGAGAAQADEDHPLVPELVGQRADADAVGGGLGVVEDGFFLRLGRRVRTQLERRFQHGSWARDHAGVGRHLGVIVGIAFRRLARERKLRR